MIMLAIVDGRPRVLTLLEIIEHFIEFRREVVRRRTEFELKKAEARAHILEGLEDRARPHRRGHQADSRIETPPEARERPDDGSSALSQIQAQAILDMQLAAADRPRAAEDRRRAMRAAEDHRAAPRDPRRANMLMEIVDATRLREMPDAFGDDRRTEIIDDTGEFAIEDLIAEEDMAITVSNTGYIKRTAITHVPEPAPRRRRAGIGMRHARRGLRQPSLRRLDARVHPDFLGPRASLLAESPRDPGRRPRRKGKAIANLVAMDQEERIAALLAVREWPAEEGQSFIVMGTERASSRRPTSRRSATRAPAASSPWGSKRAIR